MSRIPATGPIVVSAEEVFSQTMDSDLLARADERYEEIVEEIEALRTIRKFRGMTQAQVADLLGISQPAIARLEARSDVQLSTLRSYARALGGRLSVSITFDDGSVVDVATGKVAKMGLPDIHSVNSIKLGVG